MENNDIGGESYEGNNIRNNNIDKLMEKDKEIINLSYINKNLNEGI